MVAVRGLHLTLLLTVSPDPRRRAMRYSRLALHRVGSRSPCQRTAPHRGLHSQEKQTHTSTCGMQIPYRWKYLGCRIITCHPNSRGNVQLSHGTPFHLDHEEQPPLCVSGDKDTEGWVAYYSRVKHILTQQLVPAELRQG